MCNINIHTEILEGYVASSPSQVNTLHHLFRLIQLTARAERELLSLSPKYCYVGHLHNPLHGARA